MWRAAEDARKASSPIKLQSNRDVVFSDVESVSTIPSRVQIHKDPELIEAGLIKLKEKILEQKMRKGGSSFSRSVGESNTSADKEIKFISPEDFSFKKPKFRPNPTSISAPRSRKVAKAPDFESYAGFNDTEQMSRPTSRTNLTRFIEPQKDSVVTKGGRQRKQASGKQTKKAVITTSSWRKGVSIAKKVLGDKTQDVAKSSSNRSTTSTSSKSPSPRAPISRLTSPKKSPERTKVPKDLSEKKESKPKRYPVKRKVENPPKKAVPKVKSRHYDSFEVQKYIERTKSERRKQISKEKFEKEKAEKEKAHKLQQLFEFQKKAVKKSVRANKMDCEKENEDISTTGRESTQPPRSVQKSLTPEYFYNVDIPFIESQ